MQSQGWKCEMLDTKFFALLFGAALLVAPGVSAQYSPPPPKQQTGQQPGQQARPTEQPGTKTGEAPVGEVVPVNKAEEDAAKAFFDLKTTDNAQVIAVGEDFLQKYPENRNRDGVYARLTQAYVNQNKDDKVLATGQKALELNPDNADVLAVLSWYMGHRYDPNALDAEQKLRTMERYSRRALELIPALVKPAGLSDEDFTTARNMKLAMAHTALALVYLRRSRVPEMTAELEQATTIDPTPDPLDFYLLGDGDARQKKYPEAEAAYERCGQMAWVWQERCKQQLVKVRALHFAAPPAPAASPAPAAPAAPAAQPEKPKPPRS